MQQGIHPEYRTVVFQDTSTGATFTTRSTIDAGRTVQRDGELPVVPVEISASSHPFWTGNQRVLDTAGRVEKFNQRYGKRTR
ncbi:type B 50S ribosomal protein L31 [Modestobacter sp. NPDC049651]|uniref:type B 50S ribosomal protein L31 n=1 Tax=unclassified Modestobacter TaxID=2643866 RepID=UPI0033C86D4A